MNYKYVKTAPLVFLLLSGLTGCSILPAFDEIIPDNTKKYRKAETMPALEIPPELSVERINDTIAGESKESTTYSEFKEAKTNPLAKKYNISPKIKPSLTGHNATRHLIVPSSKEVSWQRLLTFWDEQRINISRKEQRIGLMDTEKGLDEYAYRLRVDSGDTLQQSLIYVNSATKNNNPQKNEAMLRQVAVFLGGIHKQEQEEIKERKKEEPQANAIKVTIIESAGGNALLVQQDFADTWGHVGRILDAKGFAVETRDRSRGLYFVHYIDPEGVAEQEEEGILSRMAFWRDDAEKTPEEYYYIKLISDAESTKIIMLDAEGDRTITAVANRLLILIQEQLEPL